MRRRYLLALPFFVLAGTAVAPTAAADCTTVGNTSICSLGDGNDDDGLTPNNSPSSLPFVPYPCAYDYYCNDGYNWFTP